MKGGPAKIFGPLLPESPAGFDPPAWWDELRGEKQVALVTEGTVATEQFDLMPHVNVMVTNGGYGGVQFALAHGVPLVVAGKSEDKADVCARVE